LKTYLKKNKDEAAAAAAQTVYTIPFDPFESSICLHF
jgi:hypothetical protein